MNLNFPNMYLHNCGLPTLKIIKENINNRTSIVPEAYFFSFPTRS